MKTTTNEENKKSEQTTIDRNRKCTKFVILGLWRRASSRVGEDHQQDQ
jgi:hypothetical protein